MYLDLIMVSVVLLGSRPLSKHCLDILHQTEDIIIKAVVTYPNSHEGWWDGSLYERATSLDIPIIDESDIIEYDVDYLISILYYNILDGKLLNHANIGGLNLHQAELPRYRGSNTFSHAIMNARKDNYWKYGTTFHFMTEKVDAGDIIARKFVDISEEDTARSLYEKTERASIKLFREMVPHIITGNVVEMKTPQDELGEKRYHYKKDSLKSKKEISLNQFCDPDRSVDIYDKIRALDFPPFEPAYTRIGGHKIHLTKNSYEEVLDQ